MKNRIFFFLLAVVVIPAVSYTEGDGFLHLSGRGIFTIKSRNDVIFPHEKHYISGLDCLRCHHKFVKGSNILTTDELLPDSDAVSCASCHNTPRDLVKAYHGMCIACHRNMSKSGLHSGPVMCDLCHFEKGQ